MFILIMPAAKKIQGFFEGFLSRTARLLNERFKPGDIIEVKHLRRITGDKSSDRSKIIFFARALQRLSDLGFLERNGGGRNSPKKFKVMSKISINDGSESNGN